VCVFALLGKNILGEGDIENFTPIDENDYFTYSNAF